MKYLLTFFVSFALSNSLHADSQGLSQSLDKVCQKQLRCLNAEYDADPETPAELKKMMTAIVSGACKNMKQSLLSEESSPALRQKAKACMDSLANTGCAQTQEFATAECDVYMNSN